MARRFWAGGAGVFVWCLTTLCLACSPTPEGTTALAAGYRHLYNLQFDAAHSAFRTWTQAHPEDPMGAVSHAAAYLFAELDRLQLLESEFFVDDARFFQERPEPDPTVTRAFLSTLASALSHIDRVLAQQPLDSNALLAKIFALGLRADYNALLTQQHVAALADMKASRVLAEQLLAARPECADAYLAIGVENTLLSLKPVLLRWLLRLGGAQTNKQAGLAALQHTATHGQYLRPYAKLLLAVAALRGGERTRARDLLAELAQEFPHNRLYTAELARLK